MIGNLSDGIIRRCLCRKNERMWEWGAVLDRVSVVKQNYYPLEPGEEVANMEELTISHGFG